MRRAALRQGLERRRRHRHLPARSSERSHTRGSCVCLRSANAEFTGNSPAALLSAPGSNESIVQRTSSFMPIERTDPRRAADAEPLRRKRGIRPAPSIIRKRGFHVVLIFVTLVLIVDALIGEKGLMESMNARRQYRQLQGSLEELRRENAALREEMRRLN